MFKINNIKQGQIKSKTQPNFYFIFSLGKTFQSLRILYNKVLLSERYLNVLIYDEVFANFNKKMSF